ncbi:MAG: hypothetical protein Q9170_000891 [Blastenia crenularia]
MPEDEDKRPSKNKASSKSSKPPWLTTPKPIKRLFDKFPLITYPPNELPKRKPIQRDRNALYMFARPEDVRTNGPSFNPTCLKWETYLKLMGVEFITVPSNNHASPTGSLPFLIPASSGDSLEVVSPVASSKLQEWAAKSCDIPRQESRDIRYEPYTSLLDHRIRNAWLHTLYLTPSNFGAVAQPLYIASETSSSLAHFSLSKNLQAAALEEILKNSDSPIVDLGALYRESDGAFSALSELLGGNEWFFGEAAPGLLDARRKRKD